MPSFFTTSSGAPKKKLYNNQIHLSKLGTSFLAKNIKYPERTVSVRNQNHAPLNTAHHITQTTLTAPKTKINTLGVASTPRDTSSLRNDHLYDDKEYPPLPSRQHTSFFKHDDKPQTYTTLPQSNNVRSKNELRADDLVDRRFSMSDRVPLWNPNIVYLQRFSPEMLRQAYMLAVHQSMYTQNRDLSNF
jgi:hypothetical protein